MSFENGTPELPHDRFELPQQLIDAIDDIEDRYLAGAVARDVEKAMIEADDEAFDAERAKIVELLKSLVESTGNSYADQKRTEFTVARLKAMGVPVDGFYGMLGQNINPEVIADKMLEERDEESGEVYSSDEVQTVIDLLETIADCSMGDDGGECTSSEQQIIFIESIAKLNQMGFSTAGFMGEIFSGIPFHQIARNLITGKRNSLNTETDSTEA